MPKYAWWNFSTKDYPKDHFQIAYDIGWKRPKFIAFSKEDAEFLCSLLNDAQQEDDTY